MPTDSTRFQLMATGRVGDYEIVTARAYKHQQFGRRFDHSPTWPRCFDCTLHHPRGKSADLHPEWVLDIAASDCTERIRVEANYPELIACGPVEDVRVVDD